jgi:hypothetical protein
MNATCAYPKFNAFLVSASRPFAAASWKATSPNGVSSAQCGWLAPERHRGMVRVAPDGWIVLSIPASTTSLHIPHAKEGK